jgi:Uma2 family endonuclease
MSVAMSVHPKAQHTLDEYLALEASTREKHEFLRGEIFAMGGASASHNLIVMNTGAEIRQQLRGKPCRVYPSDLRVKVSPGGLYTYPDIVVACTPEQFEQPGDTLVNPTVLIEVLSESSEAYDRGAKFEQYRALASLRAYLLIAQNRILVEQYARQVDDRWLLTAYNRADDIVIIEALDCRIAVAEIYLNVDGFNAADR